MEKTKQQPTHNTAACNIKREVMQYTKLQGMLYIRSTWATAVQVLLKTAHVQDMHSIILDM